MIPTPFIKNNRGFSLLEVLFAVIILAVALLATARLHGMVTQDGSFAKARGIAAQLAQEKLDDIKSFTALYNDPDTTVDECAAPAFCYSEIANNLGGTEDPAGGLALNCAGPTCTSNTTPFTIGNASYNRVWTVTDYYNCTASAAASTSNCAAPNAKAYPDFKTIALKVEWTDEKGDVQNVVLQTAVYASDPSSQARMTASKNGGGPKVSYTPIGVPDAVPVPINTGNTKFKESSKPVPDVQLSGKNIEVSFDAVTYADNGSGGYDTTQREEFTTVSCECGFNGTAPAYTPSRMIWNGSNLEAKVGVEVSKPTGAPASGQSVFCDSCCKDHHDIGGFSGTSYAKYDPDRPSSEYAANGNHKHYWYRNCVSGTLGNTSGCTAADKDPANGYGEVDAGAYLESCRFKRVNGLWRLWQDWRQVKMTVLPYDFLPVTSNLKAYVDVIEAVVENTIRKDSGNGTKTIPALPGRDIAFSSTGQTNQLLGRAVFVDRIYKKAAPADLDTDYYTSIVGKVNASGDWLHLVPFYEANLTLLIDWKSATPAHATVTSDAIVDISNVSSGYYSSYSRGKVTGVAAGTSVITATARLHNTGVTGGINTSSPSYGISDYDNVTSASSTDSITVTVSSSTTNVGISGKLVRANSSVAFSTLNVTGATCTLGPALNNELPYNCTAPTGSNVTLTYSGPSGYGFSSSTKALGIVSASTTVSDITVYGPTVKIWGDKTASSSSGSKITGVSGTNGIICTVPGSGSSYECNVARGTSGYTGDLTYTGNKTYITPSTYSFSGQQADIQIDVKVFN